jgi:hypothetical protein
MVTPGQTFSRSGAIGYLPYSRDDTKRRNCNGVVMLSILKSVFAVLVFACAVPAVAAEQVVIVNGARLHRVR